MLKHFLMMTLTLLNVSFVSAQNKNINLQKFTNSFYQSFHPPKMSFINSNFITASLLFVHVGSGFSIDSVYFSDSAPDWQVDELEKMRGRLNLVALKSYARDIKFIGKLAFPVILKSELTKGAIKEEDIHTIYYNLFRHQGALLSGIVRFEDCLIKTAGKTIKD